jgi:hypothetical protein
MNTDRLRKFLGEDYENVIQYTVADAFADCFSLNTSASMQASAAAHKA